MQIAKILCNMESSRLHDSKQHGEFCGLLQDLQQQVKGLQQTQQEVLQKLMTKEVPSCKVCNITKGTHVLFCSAHL